MLCTYLIFKYQMRRKWRNSLDLQIQLFIVVIGTILCLRKIQFRVLLRKFLCCKTVSIFNINCFLNELLYIPNLINSHINLIKTYGGLIIFVLINNKQFI